MPLLENDDIFLTTTDTIIGIGGKVNNIVKEKIYNLKQRDRNKKLIIVISSLDQLKVFEKINDKQMEYIEKYWPGPYTLIINGNAYRMPNNNDFLKFISDEGPFYLTSANISNEPSILSVLEAKQMFPTLKVFDFGNGSNRPSTIIDTKDGKILR